MDSSPIILPPSPKPGKTPAEDKARLTEWTRQAEQAVRKLHGQINDLQAQISGGGGGGSLPAGGVLGDVLTKQSATNGDAIWSPSHYVPVGGTTKQALRKNSATDYDASFADVHEPPAGGSTGQILAKNSATDYDYSWTSAPAGLPTGGTTGQVLRKNSATNFDASFLDVHEVPAGGNKSNILTKNSGTDYDASWKSILSAYGDGLAVDIFDEYPTGVITAPSGGLGWASAGRVVGGSIVNRALPGGRTQNRLQLGPNSTQYGRTWNWGSDWSEILLSVLFRIDGPLSSFNSAEFAFGMCSGTVGMWGDPTTPNWQGMIGRNGSGSGVTWAFSTGNVYNRYTGNQFGHALKQGSTITALSGAFAKQMCIPQTEQHLMSLSLRLPRGVVAPSTAQSISYNFYAAGTTEGHQEVGYWLNSLINSPFASGSDFSFFHASTSSTLPSASEAAGGYDSFNFWWNNTSSANAELAAIACVRKV